MARVVSGVVLAAAFFALIWFGNTATLLIAALIVATLAVQEYANLVRGIGNRVPIIPALAATWAAGVAVPFPRVPVEIVIAITVIVIAISVMAAEASLKAGALGAMA